MKSLACIFGQHRWTTRVDARGEEFKRCDRCGKLPAADPLVYGGPEGGVSRDPDDLSRLHGAEGIGISPPGI